MSTDARADKRVAFVVGNGAYTNAAQLSSPPNDAIAMATMLRNVGFDVIEGTNLSRSKMTEKLLDFGERAQCADIAVFFYAGHSIALNRTNYLLPVDADIKSEMDVRLGAAINMDSTLETYMNKAKVKLVFLDASYDNPFAARIKSNSTRVVSLQTGLASMSLDAGGMLVAFAAGPGQVVLDGSEVTISRFTRALISHVAQPGVEILQAMIQVRGQLNEETNKSQFPGVQTNLKGPVYLNPVHASPATGTVAATSPSLRHQHDCKSRDAEEEEEKLWRSVKDTENAQDIQAYLKTYPKGQFSPLALGKLDSLNRPQLIPLVHWPDSAASGFLRDKADEDKIGLNRGQHSDVQRQLTALGFDIKTTGEFDHDTRWAIKRWQAARGYAVSGYLNVTQHEELSAKKRRRRTW